MVVNIPNEKDTLFYTHVSVLGEHLYASVQLAYVGHTHHEKVPTSPRGIGKQAGREKRKKQLNKYIYKSKCKDKGREPVQGGSERRRKGGEK